MAGFEYSGTQLRILTWSDGTESWDRIFAAHSSQYGAHLAQLQALLQRLGDFGTLRSPDQMHTQRDGIIAVKSRFGFRAYGWYDRIGSDRVFVVGRVCLKKENKADQKDIDACCQLRSRFKQATGGRSK